MNYCLTFEDAMGDLSVTSLQGCLFFPQALGLNLFLCGAILRVSHGDKISIIQSIYLSGGKKCRVIPVSPLPELAMP